MNTQLADSLSVAQILGRRLAVLSSEDVESRARTSRAMQELRDLTKMLESLGDWDD